MDPDEIIKVKNYFKHEMKFKLPWKSLVQFCFNCGSYLHIKADSDTTNCMRCNTQNIIEKDVVSKSKISFNEPKLWLKDR